MGSRPIAIGRLGPNDAQLAFGGYGKEVTVSTIFHNQSVQSTFTYNTYKLGGKNAHFSRYRRDFY